MSARPFSARQQNSLYIFYLNVWVFFHCMLCLRTFLYVSMRFGAF